MKIERRSSSTLPTTNSKPPSELAKKELAAAAEIEGPEKARQPLDM